LVEKAIPMSFGDSYEGYRIVGTNHDYPEHYSVELSEGSLWNKPMEAVIGHNVAQELKLGIGDTFFGVHGLTSAMEAHDAHPYRPWKRTMHIPTRLKGYSSRAIPF
jgi:putative ABC transport system permease protein